jgi:biopolymer transport protein ExbD
MLLAANAVEPQHLVIRDRFLRERELVVSSCREVATMRVRRRSAESEIPTASMADIAFLLIIFFMVTTVFSATKGLELKLPDEKEDPEPEPAVLIHVRSDGVSVDCEPMELDAILPYLEPRLTRNPNKPVILYTDSQAAYRDMVAVYDLLASAKTEGSPWGFSVSNISVPTRRDIEGYVQRFGMNPLETSCGP